MPDISWTTEYAILAAPYKNIYAEIGTTWASSVVTFPTVAAHILGQLMKFMGPDRILFGSDSVWYGSPQWQIDAFWRFQIPEEMRKKYGYPELTPEAKRKILGLNSAKLYGINPGGNLKKRFKPVPADYEQRISKELKTILEFPGLHGRQHVEVQAAVCTAGPAAEPHTVRLDSREGVSRGYRDTPGEHARRAGGGDSDKTRSVCGKCSRGRF